MVSIVIPKNSLPDLINAGLTVRHYTKKSEKTNVYSVSETAIEKFWSEIRKYVDKNDHSLIILNLPLPSEETLKSIDLKPYEYSILYIPSELVSMTPQSKRILLEKGIVFMPQRSTSKCFPGEYIDKVEKRWMAINKILSFESELTDQKSTDIIIGLLRLSEENPLLAIERIAEDDADFFRKKGKEALPKTLKQIEMPSLEIRFTEAKRIDLIPIAFYHFLSNRKIPIGIKGESESVVITESPTFADSIFDEYNIKAVHKMKLGKAAAILTDLVDDVSIGLLLGRLSQRNVLIEFGYPKFVVRKTLLRKLVGGKGPKGRVYKGLKERYPNLLVKKDTIRTPRAAIENVIDILRETGTEFKIIS